MQDGARWDELLTELQDARRRAGEPSYADIARRVGELRVAAGVPEAAARIAKSTVHDAFRLGRSRINLGLTREILAALGEDPALVDRHLAPPAPMVEPPDEPAPTTTRDVILLLVACVALNLLGREFVDVLALPVHLDMVGTAVAAVAVGPWRGAAVGLATNLLGAAGSGWVSVPFALVNVVGALAWGYGVHRWRLGRTLPRFFGLTVLVGLLCSVVAAPLVLWLDEVSARVGRDGGTVLSTLLTSQADKLMSGFAALAVVSVLPVAYRRGLSLLGPPEIAIRAPHSGSIR